jgi:hypothetical protein
MDVSVIGIRLLVFSVVFPASLSFREPNLSPAKTLFQCNRQQNPERKREKTSNKTLTSTELIESFNKTLYKQLSQRIVYPFTCGFYFSLLNQFEFCLLTVLPFNSLWMCLSLSSF